MPVYRGPIFVDNIRLCGSPSRTEAEPALVMSDFAADNAESPETYSKIEYTFRLSRTFENPFDPECVDIRARVMTPSGKMMTVPGFFYQGYRRRVSKEVTVRDWQHKKRTMKAPHGVEVLEPAGGSVWKVRLAASEPGQHVVEIQVLVPDGKGGMSVALRRKGLGFKAVKGRRPGYVRLARDGRHFEHSGGEFFYPLGMALRSPSDTRDPTRDRTVLAAMRGGTDMGKWVLAHNFTEDRHDVYVDLIDLRGTYQFDDYFRKCGESGMNWARVWMCPWWLGLEWDHRYPGYEGAGRYNLANGWRMDHVIEQAEKTGMFLQVCLTNHGQVCARIDREWDFHPYRWKMPKRLYKIPDHPAFQPERLQKKRPGGFLKTPRDWFIDERAKKLTRNRLRYVVARWGYTPNIMGFALMSEVEFTGGTSYDEERRGARYDGRPFPLQTAWHKEMAHYLRTIDPFRHLVTTHFSHPLNGYDVWNTQTLDYVQSNAYSSFTWLGGKPPQTVGAPRAMKIYYDRFMRRWRRPVVIGEWGGHWMRNSTKILDAELHTGLWAEAATPMAGATGYWWWLHVHYNNRYGEFAALARFVKGEDMRGITRLLEATVQGGGDVEALAAGDGKSRAYAYVYSQALTKDLSRKSKVGGAVLTLNGMAGGAHEVEFWDTWKGQRIRTDQLSSAGGPLKIPLPEFRGDLAVKVRPGGKAGAKAPEAPAAPKSAPKSAPRGARTGREVQSAPGRRAGRER
jgi:hypothetical protein